MNRILLLSSAALLAGGCHMSAESRDRDAGPATNRTYPAGSFDQVEVAGPYEVKITTGGQPSISATGGSSLLDETEVKIENGVLKIGPKKHNGFRWNWRSGKAVFTVTTAALHAASIAGSGEIEANRVEGGFQGDVAGSGRLTVGEIGGGEATFSVAGSGDVRANGGTADLVKLEIAGSGDIDTAGVSAKAAEVSIAGSGNAKAKASDTAKVSIAGSGNVDISGGAKCTTDKIGSGNVNCS